MMESHTFAYANGLSNAQPFLIISANIFIFFVSFQLPDNILFRAIILSPMVQVPNANCFPQEVRLAIEYIVIPGREPVELLPRCSEIIARQLELVESYQLAAEKTGTELNSRLQILPMRLNKKNSSIRGSDSCKQMGLNSSCSGYNSTSVSRLPLLPE